MGRRYIPEVKSQTLLHPSSSLLIAIQSTGFVTLLQE